MSGASWEHDVGEGKASLRDLLGASPDPDFELALPRGWERLDASPESQELVERRLSRKFMQVGTPDAMKAYAVLRGMFRQSVEEMRRRNVVAYFAPSAQDESPPFVVPASIVATIRTAPSSAEMDGYVKRMIVEESARPLGGNRSLLRLERENVRPEGEAQVVLNSTLYVTPVPGSRRRRALELVAGYARPIDMARDDDRIQTVHSFFDLMVSSLRWRDVER